MPAPAIGTSTVIDVLRDGAWNGGAGLILTYSVPTGTSTWPTYSPGQEPDQPGYGVFSAAQANAFRAAMELWDSYVEATFNEVADNGSGHGQIRAAFTTTPPGVAAYAALPLAGSNPNTLDATGDIWISSNSSGADFAQGTSGFFLLLHEIGHALGLDHTHNDTPGGGGSDFLPAEYDNARYSVMSYNGIADGVVYEWIPGAVPAFPVGGGGFVAVLTPMLFDILVVQDMFGASTTTNAGATTYIFDPDTPSLQTIYDSGGVDTFDLTGHMRPSIIDLRPASFSSIDYYSTQALIDDTVAIYDETWRDYITGVYSQPDVFTWSNNVAIAYGVTIENVLLGEGDDSVIGNSAANALHGNGGDDNLDGRIGNDTLEGGDGSDTLYGGDGDDTIDGGAGADVMIGNLGDDTYYVDDAGDTVSEGNIAGGTDTVFSSISYFLSSTGYGDHLTLTGAAVEGRGNALANTITGNAAANVLWGIGGDDTLNAGGGNDSMYGGDGADILDGGTGADAMVGNFGDDTYYVDDLGDTVSEGNIAGGTDTVFASVSFFLGPTGYADHLTLTGTAVEGRGNSIANTLTGNAAANVLWGNGGDDTLNAGAGNDSLYGGDGADILDGGTGADAMIGNFGNDTYYVDNAGDVVSEGNIAGGTDTVFASVSFNLGPTGYADHLTLTGASAINATGNSLANTLTGNGAANVLQGNAGNDVINAGDGNDTLYGADGNDTLDGGTGADAMIGNLGDDAYYVDNAGDTVSEGSNVGGTDIVYASVSFNLGPTGFVENLTLTGSAAINATGNAQANTLTGNSGANTLTGGAGADSFVFSTPLGGGNVDAIADFSAADDTIVLSNAVFTGLASGALAAGAFVIGASAADAGDRIVYDSATGQLFFDADGAGGAAQVLFATLNAGLALTSADFIVSGP